MKSIKKYSLTSFDTFLALSKTTEEIETMLADFLNAEAGSSTADNSTGTVQYSNTETSDVDAAFKELLS